MNRNLPMRLWGGLLCASSLGAGCYVETQPVPQPVYQQPSCCVQAPPPVVQATALARSATPATFRTTFRRVGRCNGARREEMFDIGTPFRGKSRANRHA